jgi:hypothetical protein
MTLFVAVIALAAFVWAGFSGGTAALSANAGDGYYITEFRRDH